MPQGMTDEGILRSKISFWLTLISQKSEIFDSFPQGKPYLLFLELVGADAAEGALVIFGQLIALVNETADGTNKLLHTITS